MRNFQPFPSLSLFHVCTLYVPFSAALLFVLFSSFSSVRAPHLLSSSYFFLPLPNAHPLALAFFVAFYNRVQRCGASQFYRGRSIRASPSRSIVAMGNSPLRLQKCCLRDTRGRRGAARKRGRAGGGWEDCWNLGGYGVYARKGESGASRRSDAEEGRGVERRRRSRAHPVPGALRVGEKFNPPVKGDDALFRRAEYSRGGNFRESLRAAVFPSPP